MSFAQKNRILYEGVISNDVKRNPISEDGSLVKTDVEKRKYKEQTGLDTLVVYTVNSECCNLDKEIYFLFRFFKLTP